MSKQLLACALTMAMLLSFVPAIAVSAEPMHNSSHSCKAADCATDPITWQPWTGTEKSGHYYLTGDVKLNSPVSLAGGDKLHLCLNGHSVDGQDKTRLFALVAGSELVVTDCTTKLGEEGNYLSGGGLVNGYHASIGGAGIYNNGGTVVLEGIRMSGHSCGCTSEDGWAGAAIHARGTGTVTVKNCCFTDNSSIEGAAITLRQDATATISNTLFHKNTATKSGGAIYLGAGNSTAGKGAKLTATDCTFTENTADRGGAFYGHKSDAQKAMPELTFTGCSFTKNRAVSGGGVAFARNAKVKLDGCTVTENVNTGNGGTALHIANNTVFTLKDTTITGNLCTNATGEAWKGALCQDNAASRYVLSGKVIIDDNFVKNGAVERNVVLQFVNSKLGVDGLAAGSKLSVLTKNWNEGKDFAYDTVEQLLELSDATDESSWQHEWIYYEDNESYIFYDPLAKKLAFTGNPIHDHCLCGDGTGAGCGHETVIWQPWGDREGEKTTLPVDSGCYYLTQDITLAQNANLSSNDDIRICLHGHTVKVDYATEGAIQDQIYYMTRNGKLTLSDCTAKTENGIYTAGKLTGGSKAVISMNKLGDGATENTLVIYDGILTGNTNTTDGGAINITAGAGSFTMYGGELSGNSAQGNGGAICAAKGSTVQLLGGKLCQNTADKSGGAVAAVEASVQLQDCEIVDNNATNYGGGLYANGATVTMDKMVLQGNACADTGGAVAVSNHTQLTIRGGEIKENTAKNAAAVCVMSNSKLTVDGGTITKNAATGDGGAIYISKDGKLTLSGGSITENTAGNKGGGLYVTGNSGELIVSGSATVQGNAVKGKTSNLHLGGSKVMTVTDMAGGLVGITVDEPGRFISTQTQDYAACFLADEESCAIAYTDGKLHLDFSNKHLHCLCGDGEGAGCEHSQQRWTPWGDEAGQADKLPTDSGYYYLTRDITLSVASNVSSNDEIYLCLNGHTVKVDHSTEGKVEDQVFFMTRNGKLTICDCTAKTENGTYTAGKLTGGSKGVISLNKLGDGATQNTLVIYDGILTGNTNTTDGGAINITAGAGSFTMYGGELSGNSAQGNGGAICAAEGSTVQLLGGKLCGNSAQGNGGAAAILSAQLQLDQVHIFENTGDNGGALYLNNVKAQLTGGSIFDNTAITAGGAAAVTNSSEATIRGGLYKNNTAPNGGGLCIMSRAHVELADGSFTGHSVTANGGALYISYNAAMTISGGTVSGNTAGVHGGGVFVDKDGQLSILGGTMENNKAGTTGGGASLHEASKLTIGGKPVIQNNQVGSRKENLHLRGQLVMQVEAMQEGAQVGITADSLPRYISTQVTGEFSGYFIPDNSYRTISLKDSKLFMDYSDEHQHCFCGDGKDGSCKHENVKWAAWEATDALPTESGSYYLLQDVVLPNAATLRTGADVKLCLNGHTVTAAHEKELVENDRVYILRNDAKLTLCDCTARTENGNYTAGKLTGGTMAAVILHGNASATFDFYDGIITGNSRSDNVGGGVILRETEGKNVMNMYGGRICDNWSKGNGGGIYVKQGCVFNLYGGAICHNTSTTFHGGGIAIVKDAVVNLYGGSVSGNTADKNGGGIFVQEGTLNILGGSVTGNTAGSNGGGISGITAKINISGGSVSSNSAAAAAGAISVSTKTQLKLTGGNLDYNRAKDGGAVCIMSDSTMVMSGGSVGHNQAQANAGGIYVSRTGTMKLSGGSVHHNSCPRNGGGIFLNNATFYFSGGDVSYNSTETASGGLLVGSSSLVEMTGGSVCGNTSVRGAGAVVQGKATFNMRGGKFEKNLAQIEAGGLYISTNSFFTLYDGEICENEAAYRGGGLLANASFTIAGGTVRANKVTGSEEHQNPYAGGVVIIGESVKTLTMTGGTICDNYSAGTGGGMRINYMNTLQMSGGVFRNNRSEKTAGGLEIYGHANITGGEFIDNYAGTVGGGLRVVSQVKLDMENVLFTGNEAATRGGAVYLAKGNWTTMKDCTFTGNRSGEQGSAIYSWDELLLDGCSITGNTAGGVGAVYLCSANYDGQSYVLSVPKIAGDLRIEDNEGPCPGLYFEDGAVAAVASQGLGEKARIQVYLQAGVLTNTLFGNYDYSGGEQVYLVTYGDRSAREYEEFEVPQEPTPDQPEQTTPAQSEPEQPQQNDSLLYVGIGVIVALLLAAGVILVLRKKKAAKH